MVNGGCIIVAVIGACLISVDLAHWSRENEQHLRVRPHREYDKIKTHFSNRYLHIFTHIKLMYTTDLYVFNRWRCWSCVCWGSKFFSLQSSACGSLKRNEPNQHDRAVEII